MPEIARTLLAPENMTTFVLLLTRVTGLVIAGPLWSMTALPAAGRAAVTVLLAALLLPLAPRVPAPERIIDVPLPLAMELVVGIVIGLAAAVIVQGATLAGEVVALQMGLSLGPALSPMPDAAVSGVGQLGSFLALLIYVAIGGHVMLLQGLATSLTVLPPGMPIALDHGGPIAIELLGTLTGVALATAAPVMVALLLSHVALALLGRAVPQLNTMMLSFPVTIAVGLVMIGVTLPMVAGALGGWLDVLPGRIESLLVALQPQVGR